MDELLGADNGVFVSCTKKAHDARLLVEVGTQNPQLAVNWYAAATWPGMDLKAFVWEVRRA